MNKAMVVILFIVSVIGVIFLSTACAKVGEPKHGSSRLIIAEIDGEWTTVYDKETKVMYLLRETTHAVGITVLLNADGKPLLWED